MEVRDECSEEFDGIVPRANSVGDIASRIATRNMFGKLLPAFLTVPTQRRLKFNSPQAVSTD
jgi:hypothetical protein